ncbi:bifunctional enoyl-CoA hydratase/phosphate acetyltransferase [Azospirillum argentinense]|uniref:Bifunctional enoyl-CoA hydratase/phosphate acetyltransferase n=1 Tax=Azospirillum brasilense TaxID=192 RepID=A0A4D8Q9Y6_AZOBR|nr:bifunctional enoyl-CoA hydratase/phosphate acetyltransferase [Azospirillum argentinense]QCO07028.1 bifunctional enoyl-CoA hydratase/phosphate acetyltransferase [Azospirillum argentinense]
MARTLETTTAGCPARLMTRSAALEPVPTAVVAAGSPVALESARRAATLGLIEPVLVGDPAAIADSARSIGWTLHGACVVPARDDAAAARIAVALARSGDVGALMKGHIHTDTLMLAALDPKNGLRTGRRFTHAFHMTLPESGRELVITDAAINVAPSLNTRLDIIRNAVELWRLVGGSDPRVALLSCTEEVTERVPSSMDADRLTRLCQQEVPGATVFGPLALDLAVSAEAARIKNLTHPCAGAADILVVPNIETGNALFKALVHFLDAVAAGIVLGAAVPIILTSRADPPAARIAAAAIAQIVAGRRSATPGAPYPATAAKGGAAPGLHA